MGVRHIIRIQYKESSSTREHHCPPCAVGHSHFTSRGRLTGRSKLSNENKFFRPIALGPTSLDLVLFEFTISSTDRYCLRLSSVSSKWLTVHASSSLHNLRSDIFPRRWRSGLGLTIEYQIYIWYSLTILLNICQGLYEVHPSVHKIGAIVHTTRS